MKRWMKGFAIAGAVLLCAGTGMTALAGAVAGGKNGRIRNVWQLREYYLEHVSGRLPGWLDREISEGLDEATAYNGWYHAAGAGSGLGGRYHIGGWDYDGDYDYGDYDDHDYDDHDYDDHDYDEWEDHARSAEEGWYDTDGVWHNGGGSHRVPSELNDRNVTLSPKEEMTLMGSYKDVRELEVQALGAYVKVVENPDLSNQINIYMKEKDKCYVTHRTDDHPYEVKVAYKTDDSRRLFSEGKYAEGIVEIPVGYRFDKLELKASASILEVSSARAEKLEAKSEAGVLELPFFEASILEVDADAGSITASGGAARSVEAEANVGQITLSLTGKREDYRFLIDNEMGSILVDGLNAGELTSGSGTSEKTIKLESSMGSIDVRFR